MLDCIYVKIAIGAFIMVVKTNATYKYKKRHQDLLDSFKQSRKIADVQNIQIKKHRDNEVDGRFSITENNKVAANGLSLLRRLTLKQTAEALGITYPTFKKRYDAGVLPEPTMRIDTANRTVAGYSYNDIYQMRQTFKCVPHLEYDPTKDDIELFADEITKEPVVGTTIGFLNQKGGCQKTTHTLYFSQYLAMQGFNVLVIDTDPQGSLTHVFGYDPDGDTFREHTLTGYLSYETNSFESAIRPTHWDNIDIVSGSMALLEADLLMIQNKQKLEKLENRIISTEENLLRLKRGIHDVSVANGYDFVLLDGTPSLNNTTLNIVSACDHVMVPAPAEELDMASTLQFMAVTQEIVQYFIDNEVDLPTPNFSFFITKVNQHQNSLDNQSYIQARYNNKVFKTFKNMILHNQQVRKAASGRKTVYDINAYQWDNRKSLKECIAMYDALFGEMLSAVLSGSALKICYTNGEL